MLKAIIASLLICASGFAQSRFSPELIKEQSYTEFNKAANEYNAEGAKLESLRERLLSEPPGYAASIDQQAILRGLIEANERKVAALKRLLKLMKR